MLQIHKETRLGLIRSRSQLPTKKSDFMAHAVCIYVSEKEESQTHSTTLCLFGFKKIWPSSYNLHLHFIFI